MATIFCTVIASLLDNMEKVRTVVLYILGYTARTAINVAVSN